MHIHGNHLNVQASDFHSTAQGQRTAAAQQAAELRKKLLKGAAEANRSVSPEESLFVGNWMDARHSRVQGEDQYHAGSSGKGSDFD